MCVRAELYERCPPYIDSYNRYCIAILAAPETYDTVSATCALWGGVPMWFEDRTELSWVVNVLQAYAFDCIHIGIYHLYYIIIRGFSCM